MKEIKYITLNHVLPLDESTNPQIRKIVESIRSIPDGSIVPWSIKDIVLKIASRQDPIRIFRYYQDDLIDLGIIEKVVTSRPVKSNMISKKSQILDNINAILEHASDSAAVTIHATMIRDLLS